MQLAQFVCLLATLLTTDNMIIVIQLTATHRAKEPQARTGQWERTDASRSAAHSHGRQVRSHSLAAARIFFLRSLPLPPLLPFRLLPPRSKFLPSLFEASSFLVQGFFAAQSFSIQCFFFFFFHRMLRGQSERPGRGDAHSRAPLAPMMHLLKLLLFSR